MSAYFITPKNLKTAILEELLERGLPTKPKDIARVYHNFMIIDDFDVDLEDAIHVAFNLPFAT